MGAMALVPKFWKSRMNPRVRDWRKKYYPDITDWAPYNFGATPVEAAAAVPPETPPAEAPVPAKEPDA